MHFLVELWMIGRRLSCWKERGKGDGILEHVDHLVAWEQVRAPKKKGGLVIGDFFF